MDAAQDIMNWFYDLLKSFDGFPIGWVDFVTLLVIGIGFVRGRKRGMSEELLDVLQWIFIVVAGAFLYRNLGDLMSHNTVLSKLTYYLLSYILIAVAISLVFLFLKKRLGQKLIESDSFGVFEFYGGMVAGSVRWLCMYLFVLSMLHAPYYSPEYLAQRAKEVDYNYGSDFFPAPCKIQASVFKDSLTGKGAEKYLGRFMMESASGNTKELRNENSLAKRRERAVDDAFGRK
jgi:uncharacterized membrane protein required for colicin V production